METGTRLSHFEIIEAISSGGMGTVYRARDLDLDRDVALKILPPDLVADATRKRRFIFEARAAAALQHPHIAVVHEIGEAGGVSFIAMELICGKSLQERIKARPLPADRALEIAIEIAEGLAFAHQKGIVHRDLKPANIMLTEQGHAKIIDFGIAKLIETIGDEATVVETMADERTVAGRVIGTVAYMSPEQALGQEIDHRSDIFSFGIVLHEMLTGKRPFEGPTRMDTISAILRAPAPILTPSDSNIVAGVLRGFQNVVDRCLAKEADTRWPDVEELLASLHATRRQLESGSSTASPTSEEQRPSIAVLPFANLSADPENEYFGDGLAEELIHALAQFENLHVPSSTSSFQFKERVRDIREVGARLGVEKVLEGSVRKVGERVRITAQLISANDGYHLWSERFDRTMEDVFAIQDEITQAIIDHLKVDLVGEPGAPLVRRYTENLEAHTLYMQGRYHWYKRYEGHLQTSMKYFRRAIEADPGHALAHCGLADAYWSLGAYAILPPGEAYSQCRSAAGQALQIDPGLAEAHVALAHVRMMHEWDWEGAEGELRLAIELKPRYAIAHLWLAALMVFLRRHEEAGEEIRLGIALEPSSSYVLGLGAMAWLYAGEAEESIRLCQKSLDIEADAFIALWVLGCAYQIAGRFEEAVEVLSRAADLYGRYIFMLGILAPALSSVGRAEEARGLIDEMEELASRRGASPALLFIAHEKCGNKKRARELAEDFYEQNGHMMGQFLLGEPPYPDILRRMGLPW